MAEADKQHDRDKPLFHVAPAAGWVNDPNGPFMYRGKYHLFYQHLPEGCEWAFGLVWGHSVSSDLVHWQHLPHAMVPTAKSLDADGCFSGCATVDTDGTPVLLYTGVRLRTNPDAQPPPPPECDLNLPFIESQLYATPADPDDSLLVQWHKEPTPFIGLPPPNMNLTGWRDPFVVERPCEANNHEWVVLMGSGIKEVGGTTIVYRTRQLRDAASWRYDGLLCVGEGDTGAVWECPLVVPLPPLPHGAQLGSSSHTRLAHGSRHGLTQLSSSGSGRLGASPPTAAALQADGPLQKQQQHETDHETANSSSHSSSSSSGSSATVAAADKSASVSPNGPKRPQAAVLDCNSNNSSICAGQSDGCDERYSHFYSISPDACTNPTIYWLGRYCDGRFDLDNAVGPMRLDLGDVLYAPNVMQDDAGRVILWGWLQERRTVGTYDYAGCMTVPRLLHLHGSRLHQTPAPELMKLRKGEAWQAGHVALSSVASLALPGHVGNSCLDIEAVFSQGSASTVGVLLRSWHQGGEGGAAVLYNWQSSLLEVVFEALDPATMAFSLTAPLARRIGGPISHRPAQPLALRLLLDGSCLEIFTSSGEVLSTRIYRGSPPHGHTDAGIEFVALDGDAVLERVAAYKMSSIWVLQEEQQQQEMAAMLDELCLGTIEREMLSSSSSLTGMVKSQQQLGMVAATAAAAMVANENVGRIQQRPLPPQLAATVHLAQQHELPLEEEMAADIFDLGGL